LTGGVDAARRSVRRIINDGGFRFDSYEAAVRELIALAPEVEVLLPDELATRTDPQPRRRPGRPRLVNSRDSLLTDRRSVHR
jgi:hypothetical protein